MHVRKAMAIGAVGLALTSGLAACGNANNDKAAKSISASLMKDSSTGKGALKQSEADCVGKAFVSKIGTDKLMKYSFIDKNYEAITSTQGALKWTADDANKGADAFVGCVDAVALFKSQLTGAMATDAAKACVDKGLTKSVVHDFISLGLQQDTSGAQAKLAGAIGSCAPSTGASPAAQ